MARPERVFSDEEVEEIRELAPVLTQEQLAEYFGITDKTLREILKRDERVFTAYTRSRYCLLYTSPSPRDVEESRMPSSA